MSRSRPENDKLTKLLPFGYGFEIGRSVEDVFLKKISHVKKNGIDIVKCYFLKNNVWIIKTLKFDTKATRNEQVANQVCLENLMATFLNGNHLKDLLHKTANTSFSMRYDLMYEALKEKRFWDVPLCIKTVPGIEEDSVFVAKYAPFMAKKDGSNNWNLSYTNKELEIIINKQSQKKVK